MSAVLLFALPCSLLLSPATPAVPQRAASVVRTQGAAMGFFDMFQESEESKARKEAEYQAQLDIIARRRNPKARAAYEAEVQARRAAASQKDVELQELQKTGGAEALEKWEQMRKDGKIDVFDKEREAGDRSLGGEGLLPDRIDESMPFIDSGYVDESSVDVMAELGKMGEGLGKLFGGGGDDKKK